MLVAADSHSGVTRAVLGERLAQAEDDGSRLALSMGVALLSRELRRDVLAVLWQQRWLARGPLVGPSSLSSVRVVADVWCRRRTLVSAPPGVHGPGVPSKLPLFMVRLWQQLASYGGFFVFGEFVPPEFDSLSRHVVFVDRKGSLGSYRRPYAHLNYVRASSPTSVHRKTAFRYVTMGKLLRGAAIDLPIGVEGLPTSVKARALVRGRFRPSACVASERGALGGA